MNNLKKPSPDHVPGPMEEAALRAYYERGSKEAVELSLWRTLAISGCLVGLLAIIATILIILRQEIHVFQVAKNEFGELNAVAVAKRFTPDEDTQMAWASRWLSELTEITPALWKRNVTNMQSKVTGVAVDQANEYLRREGNNPVFLTQKFPSFVREYERKSVNKISDMTYIVRYDLVTRSGPGASPIRQSYVATLSLAVVGHRNRDDVFRNPEGLAVSNFSISEES